MKGYETMIKIIFVCHGNICRSTMAEFVFSDYVKKKGLSDRFHIDSAATSTEEIGNGVHYGTRRKMQEMNIPVWDHRARQMTKKDYERFDYIIGMDEWNRRNMMRILKNDPMRKVHLFLDFGDCPRDIADPWYTGNFDKTYLDIVEGCEVFFAYLKDSGRLYER